jgi:hypothetical protein
MVNLILSLLGMSWRMTWRMIEVQAQLRSAIQSRMMFFDFNEVNFGKLATHWECLIPGQARLNCDNTPPKRMFPTS